MRVNQSYPYMYLLTEVDIWTCPCLIFFSCLVRSCQWFYTYDCCSAKTTMLWDTISMVHKLSVVYISILILYSTMWIQLVHYFTVDLCRFLESLSFRNYFPVLLVSNFLLNSLQLSNHVVGNERKQQCHLHLSSSIGMNSAKSVHHLASSCISSPTKVVILSPHKISVSLSLLDSVWRNLRDSIVPESILSSKGQFASSKLRINRDTWGTHKSAPMI